MSYIVRLTKMIQMYLQNSNRLTDLENKHDLLAALVVAKEMDDGKR